MLAWVASPCSILFVCAASPSLISASWPGKSQDTAQPQPPHLVLGEAANNHCEEYLISVRHYFDFSVCWSNCYFFLFSRTEKKRTAFNICLLLVWATTHFQLQYIHRADIWLKRSLFFFKETQKENSLFGRRNCTFTTGMLRVRDLVPDVFKCCSAE